jgi:hypothetical protein
VISPNHRSTWFSQELPVGVKVEVKPVTLLRFEPTLDGCALMRAVVVHHEVDVEIRRHFLFQLIQEAKKLSAAMTRQTTADGLPIQNMEGSKESRGPMSQPCAMAWFGMRMLSRRTFFDWFCTVARSGPTSEPDP